MMNKNNVFYKLEMNIIFEYLINESMLINTKDYFKNMIEFNNIDIIREELSKVNEALSIILRLERSVCYVTTDYYKLLDLASKGGILSPKELFQTVLLYSSVKANQRLKESIDKLKIEAYHFNKMVNYLTIDETFYQTLIVSVDEEGNVLDTASPSLKRIRSKIKGLEDRIKSKLHELISNQSSFLTEPLYVIRDDRYCLLVKAEYKNSYRGILHDVSSSMQTVYMEPLVINEMSNEIDLLKNEEKEEVTRIIKNLSTTLSYHIDSLRSNYETFVNLDIIFTKAKLAASYDCKMPKVNNNGFVKLDNAKHPLLKVSKVIPNNVSFGKDYQGIIITGPNTGGKTVLLKTIGLFCLLVKYGLLTPCDETSDINIFDNIFCDIGDDQSISDNLSTFSSHMKKIINVVDNVTSNSLVLFDEIGAGTDPLEGASLSISILNYFLKKNISFIVTTHYTQLKAYAYSTNKIVNASMEFSKETNKPTYHLIIGKSGSSNALEIARSLGLSNDIIEDAKERLLNDSNDAKKYLENLEKMQDEVEILKEENCKKLKENTLLQNELNNKLNNIENYKEKVVSKAMKEANILIEKAKKEALEILESIKEFQNKNLKLHEVINMKSKIDNISDVNLKTKKKKRKELKDKEFKVGTSVYIYDYEQYGVIKRIRKDNTFDVSVGNITINVSIEDLEVSEEQTSQVTDSYVSFDNNVSSRKVSLTLDLRGKRYYEAKELLDKYIDDLKVSKLLQATIIHGFGTGTIREVVQDYLKKCKDIDTFRYGGAGEGGLGVTVITLKK